MPVSAYSAVIAAGGSGLRFGGAGVVSGVNKLREKVGGKAVLSHSLDKFADDDDCLEVILCAGPAVRGWIEANPLVFSGAKLRVVDGGATRAESVRSGVEAAQGEYIAIHDGARPNFSVDLLARLKRAAQPRIGVVPAIAVSDTLAYVESTGETKAETDFFGKAVTTKTTGTIKSHADRENMYAVQTPQFFETLTYREALDRVGEGLAGFSDDSALYIAGGYSVVCVTGAPTNIKLTTPDDMQLLLKLMGGGEKKGKDKYGGLGW
ncbi:MAG: 2-C-methyl-D-erythritol 4-phosphate cytidylyltransferase [bacterium]|nr:2-C-methyl-D-erythritol 4-phosphate cytidylyltransferase [bacterium]